MRPLLGNQLPVPAKDGVRRDQRRDVAEYPSAQCLTEHGQPPTLVVGQLETLPAELQFEDAVLLPQVLDGGVLVGGWRVIQPVMAATRNCQGWRTVDISGT